MRVIAYPDEAPHGPNHFIIGHFGKIENVQPTGGEHGAPYFLVRMLRNPLGGPLDMSLPWDVDSDPEWDIWPMLDEELEAVD